MFLQEEKSIKKRKRRPGQSPISSYSTSTYMILYFNSDFNNLDYSSLQNNYTSFVSDHLHQFQCPNANCSHSSHLCLCTTYKRYVVFDIDKYITLTICVVVCPSCGSYHAILPSFLLPFHSYTYPFILRILSLYFLNRNKTKTCDIMHISRKVLNHLLTIFSKEEVRADKRNMDLSRLKAIIKNPSNELQSFILDYLCPIEHIIFLLPCIHRAFFVIDFIPLEE